MNNQIKALNDKLADTAANAAEIETQLQAEWNKVFDSMPELREAVSKLECSNEYTSNEHGEIAQWVRFDTSPFRECADYLREYLRESYCADLDTQSDALTMSQGDDALVIQDDTRHDNGVWQSSKVVIKESDYRDDDGEIDESKRNTLIEKHMEKTGCYPGVFRVDYYGNIFPVNTQAAKELGGEL